MDALLLNLSDIEWNTGRDRERKEDITQCTYYVNGMSLLIHRGNVPLPSFLLGYAIYINRRLSKVKLLTACSPGLLCVCVIHSK